MRKNNWVSTFLPSLRSERLANTQSKWLAQAIRLRQQERLQEFKVVLKVSYIYFIPIYLGFWLVDVVFSPVYKWVFLSLRLCIVPAVIFSSFLNKRSHSLFAIQWNGIFLIFISSLIISIMTFFTGGSRSEYYAGLNLVAIIGVTFLPWEARFLPLLLLTVFGVYYAGFFFGLLSWDSNLAVQSAFIFGTAIISIVIRYFREIAALEEVVARVMLNHTLEQRNITIEKKTKEAVQLQSLSQQFSPQIVQAIRSGEIQVAGHVHRAKIGALFVDIVNSTARITRLDNEQIHKVISMFMEDTTRILLKYDITIDKFLGDGILAFNNDPVPYPDYTNRIVRAALEIRDRIQQRQYLYENYWMNVLQIRIGIASGWANVGFYGHDKSYHSYTAIGPVMNMASRLCSIANPNQIVVSYDVMEGLNIEEFEFEFLGKKELKGFETDIIKVFSIERATKRIELTADNMDCPQCRKIMHVDTNARGIFIFKCRECGYEENDKNNLAS